MSIAGSGTQPDLFVCEDAAAPPAPSPAKNSPLYAHCNCCGEGGYVALYCEWCAKIMCAACLADEFVDFPCYCGVDSETADWARDRYRKRLATLKRLGPEGLEQMKQRRVREREDREAARNAWREADPRELCACGHCRKDHGVLDGHPCYWSQRGEGGKYEDCACEHFTRAQGVENAA